MDLKQFEAAAAGTPPSAPVTPSEGYPTNGDPQSAVPATKPGEYWFYQIQEELRNLIEDEAGLTPDHEDLTQLAQALSILIPDNELPLGALDYPTISTSDNKIGATSASAEAGGTVSVPADKLLALGEVVTANETGRMRSFKTVAWQSADLDINSTYYLRARVNAGALQIYVQKGTDADTIPAGLVGTPGGAAGGGFDSTVLDALLAKVVTAGNGSIPTVTNLANKALLRYYSTSEFTSDFNTAWTTFPGGAISLNWARTPQVQVNSYGMDVETTGIGGTTAAHIIRFFGVRPSSVTRYGFTPQYCYQDDQASSGGTLGANLRAEA